MADRKDTMRRALDKFREAHSVACPKPDPQLMHNPEGMVGVGCLGCGKVIELPVLTLNTISNLMKWEEVLKEVVNT